MLWVPLLMSAAYDQPSTGVQVLSLRHDRHVLAFVVVRRIENCDIVLLGTVF
jgi:hypothetical protein